jgi:hypothetical protein
MDGQYQNNIDELPTLEDYRYENIFKIYQKGDKNFYYYNILQKIEIPDDMSGGLLSSVKLDRNIPLTTLSYNLYGTTHLWWLILIVNKIQNPCKDLPVGYDIKYVKKNFIKTVMSSITNQLQ